MGARHCCTTAAKTRNVQKCTDAGTQHCCTTAPKTRNVHNCTDVGTQHCCTTATKTRNAGWQVGQAHTIIRNAEGMQNGKKDGMACRMGWQVGLAHTIARNAGWREGQAPLNNASEVKDRKGEICRTERCQLNDDLLQDTCTNSSRKQQNPYTHHLRKAVEVADQLRRIDALTCHHGDPNQTHGQHSHTLSLSLSHTHTHTCTHACTTHTHTQTRTHAHARTRTHTQILLHTPDTHTHTHQPRHFTWSSYLWRSIEAADQVRCDIVLARHHGTSKITQLYFVVALVNEDVVRLNISVQHPTGQTIGRYVHVSVQLLQLDVPLQSVRFIIMCMCWYAFVAAGLPPTERSI